MGGEGRALYIGCVYIHVPTDSTSVAAVDAGYVRLMYLPLDKRESSCYLVISMLERVDL